MASDNLGQESSDDQTQIPSRHNRCCHFDSKSSTNMAEFAIPVPDDVVKQSGTLSRFPTAVHREHARCLAAANKIRDDFAAQVDSDLDAKTTGHYPALGAVHVVAFTIPECLPERLALMTRFTDFTIMNDGRPECLPR